jgi:hypothetical protein
MDFLRDHVFTQPRPKADIGRSLNGAALAAPKKSDNPSDLRYQQRRKKNFYRQGVCLGVRWHTSLGFEPIAAVCAGPKIQH